MNRHLGKLVYSAAQSLRGKPVMTRLRQLERSERLAPQELKTLQSERLRSLLEFSVARVPYYRELLRRSGASIERITDLQAFGDLVPTLSKEDVFANHERMIPDEPRDPVYFTVTSGSTGTPLRLGRDRQAAGAFWAALYRGRGWHAVGVGSPTAKVWGTPRDPKAARKQEMFDRMSNVIQLDAPTISEASALAFHERCRRHRPVCLYGYPSAVGRFAEMLIERGLSGRDLGLRIVHTTGELLYPVLEETLQSVFGVPVVDEYSTNEFGTIAFECPEGRMHVAAENVLLEIDPATASSEDPRRGELLVTGLVNYAMPLIRYRMGDVVRLTDESCPCGRSLPLIETVEGRTVGFAETTAGERVCAVAFSYLMKEVTLAAEGLSRCRFVQESREKVRVEVVRAAAFDERITGLLQDGVRTILGRTMEVAVEFVDAISPDPSGKLRYFISEIDEPGRGSPNP